FFARSRGTRKPAIYRALFPAAIARGVERVATCDAPPARRDARPRAHARAYAAQRDEDRRGAGGWIRRREHALPGVARTLRHGESLPPGEIGGAAARDSLRERARQHREGWCQPRKQDGIPAPRRMVRAARLRLS